MASKEISGSDSSTPLEGGNTSQDTDSPSPNINDNQNVTPTPPDGGLKAWMQVAASWLIMFNVLGLLNSYGQFQTIYETDILQQETASTISWIGSTQFLICYVVCVFTGPIWDTGHVRFLLGVGTIIMVFGLMMLSLCHEYYQFFLAQTIVTGIGFGFVFLPASGIVPQWFSTHAAFAIGVSTTGSSLGAVLYPIMLQRLIPKIGFPWTVRIIAFMVLASMVIVGAVMRVRIVKDPPKRKVLDLKHFKDIPYLLSCLSFFVSFLGLYVFYYYINLYAMEVVGTPPDLASYLLAILNAGSFFGRLLPNYIAGHLGLMNVQIIFGIMSSALAFTLIRIKSTAGVIVFTVIYGFVSAPYVSLPIPIVTSLSPDKSIWGTRLGMSFAIIGLGALIGGPAAGAILGNGSDRNWTGLIIWCGTMFMASAAILTYVRILKVGFKLLVKI